MTTTKPAFLLRYRSSHFEKAHESSRERAAYLLRAARSRRSDNIARQAPHRYVIRDANVELYAA